MHLTHCSAQKIVEFHHSTTVKTPKNTSNCCEYNNLCHKIFVFMWHSIGENYYIYSYGAMATKSVIQYKGVFDSALGA